MTRRKVIIAAAGCAVLVAAAAVFFHKSVRWVDGEQMRYSLAVETTVLSTDRRTGSVATFNQVVAGDLHCYVTGESAEGITMLCRLEPVSVMVNKVVDPLLTAMYSKEFMLVLNPSGLMLRGYFDHSVAAKDEDLILNMMRAFQFSLRRFPQLTYRAEEDDANGTVRSGYSFGGNRLIKRKNRYVSLRGGDNISVAVRNAAASFTFSHAHSWFDTAQVSEHFVATGKSADVEARIQVETRISGEMTYQGPGSGFERSRDSFLKEEAAAPKAEFSYWDIKEQELSRAMLKGESVKSLLQKIRGERRTDEKYRLIQMMKNYFRLNPDKALQLPDQLIAGLYSDDDTAVIFHALQLTDTAVAHKVLSIVMNDPRQKDLTVFRSIMAASGSKRADRELRDALFTRSAKRGAGRERELSNTAVLALGTLKFNADREGIDEDLSINEALHKRLNASSDEDEQAAILGALGNTKDSSNVPQVMKYISSGSVAVRASAVQALRYMKDEDIPDTVTGLLATEDSQRVRSAAVDVLLDQPASGKTVKRVSEFVTRESDEKTRVSMYRYLYENRRHKSDMLEVLEAQLRTENSKSGRSYLQKAIYALKEEEAKAE